MDIVTFETALKLKEAGFPQPRFTPGIWQFWYGHGGLLGVSMQVDRIHEAEGSILHVPNPSLIFAPTAADVLQELGDGYFLMLDGCFEIDQMSEQYGTSPAFSRHENPAEPAALAYLKLKE